MEASTLIITKFCTLHKKHNRYEGIFFLKNKKLKVQVFTSNDWYGPQYDILIYKFRKGRYEFIRREHNDISIVNGVTYIVEKVQSRNEI